MQIWLAHCAVLATKPLCCNVSTRRSGKRDTLNIIFSAQEKCLTPEVRGNYNAGTHCNVRARMISIRIYNWKRNGPYICTVCTNYSALALVQAKMYSSWANCRVYQQSPAIACTQHTATAALEQIKAGKKKKQGCHDNETDKKTQICAKPSKTLPIHLTKVWHQGILGAASVQFVTSFATLKLPVHSCIKLKDWILRTWRQQISCIPTIKISRYIVMSRKELLCGIKHC